jgi:hypothetical protein
MDALRQCTDRRGLRQSRHPFQQDMSIRQQPNQQSVDEMALSHDGFRHFLLDSRDERVQRLDLFIQLFNLRFHDS